MLEIEPFEAIAASDRVALLDEGARLTAFAATDADADVVVLAPTS